MSHVLLRSTPLLLSAALLPDIVWGQQRAVGPTLTKIVSSGEGVARTCLQSGYSYGLGARLAMPVLTKRITLQVAGRGYWLARGSTCVDGFPPPDGTFVEEDRVNLQSRPFVTTDVRLGVRLGETPLSVAVGGGNAWHEGYDLPYLVFAAALPVLDRQNIQLDLQGEYQWLRVSGDRFRRTYQDFELIAEEPLGLARTWSHAAIIEVYLAFLL
jgi:hypothetical protein